MEQTKITIKVISKSGRLPAYATVGAAGADICACLEEPIILQPGERRLIPTGLFIEIPQGIEAQIRARSGLSIKHGIGLVNGVGTVDSDYRGEIMVALHNQSGETRTISHGERIAQLVIAPYLKAEFTECAELSDTVRGAGGFGSTGKFGN